jgi:hypothetical protein
VQAVAAGGDRRSGNRPDRERRRRRGDRKEPLGTISFELGRFRESYENFQAFLQSLETNLRLFDVQAITLAIDRGERTRIISTYGLTVVTYYQGS